MMRAVDFPAQLSGRLKLDGKRLFAFGAYADNQPVLGSRLAGDGEEVVRCARMRATQCFRTQVAIDEVSDPFSGQETCAKEEHTEVSNVHRKAMDFTYRSCLGQGVVGRTQRQCPNRRAEDLASGCVQAL